MPYLTKKIRERNESRIELPTLHIFYLVLYKNSDAFRCLSFFLLFNVLKAKVYKIRKQAKEFEGILENDYKNVLNACIILIFVIRLHMEHRQRQPWKI